MWNKQRIVTVSKMLSLVYCEIIFPSTYIAYTFGDESDFSDWSFVNWVFVNWVFVKIQLQGTVALALESGPRTNKCPKLGQKKLTITQKEIYIAVLSSANYFQSCSLAEVRLHPTYQPIVPKVKYYSDGLTHSVYGTRLALQQVRSLRLIDNDDYYRKTFLPSIFRAAKCKSNISWAF